MSAADAIDNAHAWFEHNSGWAPPDPETLAEWMADGVCRCPDECLTTPEGWCDHGLASWWLILGTVEARGARGARGAAGASGAAAAAHRRAIAAGEPGYIDPGSGLFVMTSRSLAERGYCCDQGCRHCPYPTPPG
jgi:hypothetical protein